MNALDAKIEEITIDAKQAHQMKALFKLAFVSGMAFKQNMPSINPDSALFNNAYQIFLYATAEETLRIFNDEMKAFENGQETELG